ncbi:MAG: Zn-finger nucleic acid-binding protein [Moritella sp.]|jgi:Zn-finger nucleic acid-binding protein
MKCPRTGSLLKTVNVGKIAVDVSEQCGGVFFDNHELDKFDEEHEMRGEVLVEHLSQFEAVILDENKRINCPKCEDIVMMRRFYSPKRVLEIDECPNCAGIWLDAGELKLLRENFLSEDQRIALFDKLVKEVDMHPDVINQKRQHEKTITRLDNFTQVLRRLFSGSRY